MNYYFFPHALLEIRSKNLYSEMLTGPKWACSFQLFSGQNPGERGSKGDDSGALDPVKI